MICPKDNHAHLQNDVWHGHDGYGNRILGAALYAESYPMMKGTVLAWGDFGKITLPAVLGINHGIVIVIVVAAFIVLFRWFEKKGL